MVGILSHFFACGKLKTYPGISIYKYSTVCLHVQANANTVLTSERVLFGTLVTVLVFKVGVM